MILDAVITFLPKDHNYQGGGKHCIAFSDSIDVKGYTYSPPLLLESATGNLNRISEIIGNAIFSEIDILLSREDTFELLEGF